MMVIGVSDRPALAQAYAVAVMAIVAALLITDSFRLAQVPLLAVLSVAELRAVGVMVGGRSEKSPSSGRIRWLAVWAGFEIPAALLVLLILPAPATVRLPGPFPVGMVFVTPSDPLHSGSGNSINAWGRLSIWYPAEARLQRVPLRQGNSAVAAQELFVHLGGGQLPVSMFRDFASRELEVDSGGRLSTRYREWPVVIVFIDPPLQATLISQWLVSLVSHGIVVAVMESSAQPYGGAPVLSDSARGLDRGAIYADIDKAMPPLSALDSGAWQSGFAGRMQLDSIGWITFRGLGTGSIPPRWLGSRLRVGLGVDSSGAGVGSVERRLAVEEDWWSSEPALLSPGVDSTEIRIADLTDLAGWSPFSLKWAGIGGILSRREVDSLVVSPIVALFRERLPQPR